MAIGQRIDLNQWRGAAARWIRRPPMPEPFAVLRALLILLIVVQAVRLLWAVVTPISPLGDWRPRQAAIMPREARAALFAGFDPFFRGASATPVTDVVTSLELTLYGVRLNRGAGTGSAIIGGADGVQNSYAVGDEIVPGATLAGLAFDHVVIERGGAREILYLDQSVPAETVGADEGTAAPQTPSAGSAAEGGAAEPPDPAALRNIAEFAPRTDGGRVTGIAVRAKGDEALLNAAGLRSGDIIAEIDGRPIGSAAEVAALAGRLEPGARIPLMVERGARTVPIVLKVGE